MKPTFLLDTSACVRVLRNQSGLEKLPSPEATAIPVFVAAELWTGVNKARDTHPQHGAKLRAFLELFPIVDFTLEAALDYADIRAALEAAGTPIGPIDLFIAAQARSLGATLVTANLKEFRRVKNLKLRSCG